MCVFCFFCNLTIHTCYTIFCAGHHQLQSLELITLFLSNKCTYVGMCTNAEVTSWSRRVTISMNKDFVNAKKKMWVTRNRLQTNLNKKKSARFKEKTYIIYFLFEVMAIFTTLYILTSCFIPFFIIIYRMQLLNRSTRHIIRYYL